MDHFNPILQTNLSASYSYPGSYGKHWRISIHHIPSGSMSDWCLSQMSY